MQLSQQSARPQCGRALSWLVTLGLVGRKHAPQHDETGKTYGQRTYVWPNMAVIAKLLIEAKAAKLTERQQKRGKITIQSTKTKV